jgi:hypothetical protein
VYSREGEGPGEWPNAAAFISCVRDCVEPANKTFFGIGGVEKGVGSIVPNRELFVYSSCPVAKNCGTGGCPDGACHADLKGKNVGVPPETEGTCCTWGRGLSLGM